MFARLGRACLAVLLLGSASGCSGARSTFEYRGHTVVLPDLAEFEGQERPLVPFTVDGQRLTAEWHREEGHWYFSRLPYEMYGSLGEVARRWVNHLESGASASAPDAG